MGMVHLSQEMGCVQEQVQNPHKQNMLPEPKSYIKQKKKQQKPKVTIDAHEAQSEVETGSEVTTSSSNSESDESNN